MDICFSNICWKQSFSYCVIVTPSYFLVFYSAPQFSVSEFMLKPHYFDHCSFVICLEVRKCESSNFVLLFKIVLVILQVPWDSIWILIFFFYFCKGYRTLCYENLVLMCSNVFLILCFILIKMWITLYNDWTSINHIPHFHSPLIKFISYFFSQFPPLITHISMSLL